MSGYIKKSVVSLAGYVPGEQPRVAGRLIKLNTNENPYPPSPRVAEALSEFNTESLRLYPDPDSRDLRGALAELHGCSQEQVFAGNGSDEVLALCTRAFVEDDGCIGYFEPSYSLYPVLTKIRDVAARPVELGPRFEWAMADDYSASLFFLTCPNAPTGIRYPKDVIRGFCARFPGVVLIDEAYVAFAEENCMDLALERDNVLVARTLSKSHSLAGLRLGYAVGHADLIGALFKIKDSYNLGRIIQAAAIAAVRGDQWARENAERVKRTRDRCAGRLAELGFEVFPSEANFLWTRPAGVDAETLYRALRERNVLVRHFRGARTGSFVRISVGTDEETDALLSAAAEICRPA